MKPCLSCDTPTPESRCPDCQLTPHRERVQATTTARGYDAAWQRLSTRARKLQPFCADAHLGQCSGPLTTDHHASAWRRREQGLAIRLIDVSVVCMRHNNIRGTARGTNVTRTD